MITFCRLIRMSQTHYNKEIRSALRSGNFGHRKKVWGVIYWFNVIQVLQKMDFATILDQRIDDYKYVAFQFAQAITLIDGNPFVPLHPHSYLRPGNLFKTKRK